MASPMSGTEPVEHTASGRPYRSTDEDLHSTNPKPTSERSRTVASCPHDQGRPFSSRQV